MCVLNEIDRFHLCDEVIDRLPQLGARAVYLKQAIHDRLIEHKEYIRKHGDNVSGHRRLEVGTETNHSSERDDHRRRQHLTGELARC